MEYAISDDTCCYYKPDTDTLAIGFPQDDSFDDMDIIESISDSIVHETIHVILNRDFSITLSCLFDLVSDSFHEHPDLFEKVLEHTNCRTWKQAVQENGFGYFLRQYESFLDNKILKEYNIGDK